MCARTKWKKKICFESPLLQLLEHYVCVDPSLFPNRVIFGAAPDRVRDLTRRVALHYTRGGGEVE